MPFKNRTIMFAIINVCHCVGDFQSHRSVVNIANILEQFTIDIADQDACLELHA